MPTGYTNIVDNGATFEQYLWRCARAFGAFIMMRDDALDAPIPERFEPSDYHSKAAEAARQKLASLQAMTLDQIERAAADDYAERLDEWRKGKRDELDKLALYQQMRERVTAWEPPTPDHVELKKFMLSQLETGKPFAYFSDPERTPKRKQPGDWHAERVAECIRDIGYHEEHYRAEVERAEERTRWVNALRESVPWVPQPEGS